MVELDVLRHCELFGSLSDKELGQVAAIAREESHEPGSFICAERELADRLFVLSEGRVQLQIRLRGPLGPAGEVTVEEVEPGRIFGWSSLVKQRRFTASARALDPVLVISLKADDLTRLFDQNPHLGFVVMKQLAEVIASRLQHTRQVCEEAALDGDMAQT